MLRGGLAWRGVHEMRFFLIEDCFSARKNRFWRLCVSCFACLAAAFPPRSESPRAHFLSLFRVPRPSLPQGLWHGSARRFRLFPCPRRGFPQGLGCAVGAGQVGARGCGLCGSARGGEGGNVRKRRKKTEKLLVVRGKRLNFAAHFVEIGA